MKASLAITTKGAAEVVASKSVKERSRTRERAEEDQKNDMPRRRQLGRGRSEPEDESLMKAAGDSINPHPQMDDDIYTPFQSPSP